jgi:hypothetical protein
MGQRERILREIHHLLASEHHRACDTRRIGHLVERLEALAGQPDGLSDLIWTSLEIRHALTSVDPSNTWRECLSWIGSPPASPRMLDFDYMRSEQRLGPDALWRTYYPWLVEKPVTVLPMLHNSGMGSIASWYLALKGVRQGAATTIVATRLYFETRQLLERLLAGSSINLVECDTGERFLSELSERRNEPTIAWLDSAETADTPALFDTVTDPSFPRHLLAIAWDNTLVPYWLDPLRDGRTLSVPVFLMRSLPKLDQLGLELASLGMLTLVAPRATSISSAALMRDVMNNLMIATKVLGATASPAAVRLLDALRLPERALVEQANRAICAATVRFANHLRVALAAPHTVVEFPHRCFVTIRCQGQDKSAVHATMTAVMEQARIDGAPIERAASVGFNFTAMSAFMALEPHTHNQETCLRVAVGGHDDDVLDEVAACFVAAVSGKRRN